MIQIGLRDGMFPHSHSMNAGGGTILNRPKHFEWNRVDELPITFYTDHCIPQVVDDDWSERKVALLIEAPKFRPKHYEWATKYEAHFDFLLTYHEDLLDERDTRWRYYPHGGSRVAIHDWGLQTKTGLVSFLATAKQSAEGHLFRHEALPRIVGNCDVFGEIAGSGFAKKRDAIAPYCFSVVIPGERGRGFFSDHIIDCFAYSTIPIFWKRYDIGDYFDFEGIITFDDLDELAHIVNNVNRAEYLIRLGAVQRNLETAKQYYCAEDWLWQNRGELFQATSHIERRRSVWE